MESETRYVQFIFHMKSLCTDVHSHLTWGNVLIMVLRPLLVVIDCIILVCSHGNSSNFLIWKSTSHNIGEIPC